MVEDVASIKVNRLGQASQALRVSGELVYDGDIAYLTSNIDPSVVVRILDPSVQNTLAEDMPHRVGGHPLLSGPSVVSGHAIWRDDQLEISTVTTLTVQMSDRTYVLGDLKCIIDQEWSPDRAHTASQISDLPSDDKRYFCGMLVASRTEASLYSANEDIFSAENEEFSAARPRVAVQERQLFSWLLTSVPVDSVSSSQITFTRACIIRATLTADTASKTSSLTNIDWIAVRRGSCWVVGDPNNL